MNELVTRRLTEALGAEPDVTAAWLFGSVARGTADARSDVDVAVQAVDWAPQRSWDLAARLALALGRSVDVVDLARAPADLARRVLRDGVVLVDRDRARRLALEVRKRNEYFDMTPLWRLLRRLPPGVAP